MKIKKRVIRHKIERYEIMCKKIDDKISNGILSPYEKSSLESRKTCYLEFINDLESLITMDDIEKGKGLR